MPRIFNRLILSDTPTAADFLSQAARREPPPRDDPAFVEGWAGLSVFDSIDGLRKLGARIKWRRGEYIAVLHIPDDAPITFRGPDHKGHWLLYDAHGEMLREAHAELMLTWVARVVHGPVGVS